MCVCVSSRARRVAKTLIPVEGGRKRKIMQLIFDILWLLLGARLLVQNYLPDLLFAGVHFPYKLCPVAPGRARHRPWRRAVCPRAIWRLSAKHGHGVRAPLRSSRARAAACTVHSQKSRNAENV